MSTHRALAALVALFIVGCAEPTTPTRPDGPAPLLSAGGVPGAPVVADEYIVAMRGAPAGLAQANSHAQSVAVGAGAEVVAVFGSALNGFAVRADARALAAIRAHPNVEFVEPVQVFTTIATQSPTPSWGLDRIDQVSLPLNASYTYPTGGVAVHVYIIDTGILLTHSQFTGRIGNGFDAVTPGGTANDCYGHGTHVAGTVGGTTHGIMKTAIMHPVRVLNCSGSGTTTQVVNGINWVTANAVAPAVSNMSIGGGASAAIDLATNNMVAAGIVSAVAAGNDNLDACNYSPARAASALTVGSTTSTDARSSFSNKGTCLDLFAPGSSIASAWIGSNTAIDTISGTSMASPHVAGVAALYRSLNPTHTAAQVAAAIVNNASLNKVTNPGTGSPNRLLYMGFLNAPPPNNLVPVARFTYLCIPRVDLSGSDCSFDGSTSSDPDGSIAAWQWTSGNKPAKSGAVVTYAYPTGSTPSVTLTVTDNLGATDTETQAIDISGGPPPPVNQAPVANISSQCVPRASGGGVVCTFDGSTSTDSDGSIVSWVWTAPGRATKTGTIATFNIGKGETLPVTLTVTDNQGATGTKTVQITVP